MKSMKLLTLLFFLFFTMSCCLDDENNLCIKEENYASVNFDGQTLEPYWHTGFTSLGYTFFVSRNLKSINGWSISIGIKQPKIYVDLYMLIDTIGFYPIAYVDKEEGLPISKKNFVEVSHNTLSTSGSTTYIIYRSMENKKGIQITAYDSIKGILGGKFHCNVYDISNPANIKHVSAEFLINMQTYDTSLRPCWL